MNKFLLSIFFFLFLNLSYGEDVICAKKTKKIVTVNPGDSFTFRTQSSRFYRPNTKCIVKYKKGEFCQELKLTCSKFVIHNKSPTCTRGDKLVVVKKGIKPERYCKANPPNLSTTSNFKLAFISNKAKQAEGAECTIECSGSETTGLAVFPSATESECIFTTDCDSLDRCQYIADARCVCNQGKCVIQGSPWYLPGGIGSECNGSDFTSCPCKENPTNCFCIFGLCSNTGWECHSNAECTGQAKCKDINCECENGLCEPGPCYQTPGVPGPCESLQIAWTFTEESGCVQFEYGGCMGNKNNFATKEECEQICIN